MSIPLATTTIAVKRATASVDAFDVRTAPTTVVSGVRAHISAPSGLEGLLGGRTEVKTFKFSCDPCDVTGEDLIVDENTDTTYAVLWAQRRNGLGLDHMTGQIRVVTGPV